MDMMLIRSVLISRTSARSSAENLGLVSTSAPEISSRIFAATPSVSPSVPTRM